MADKITLENVKVGKDGVELKQSHAGKEYAQFTAMWSSSKKDQSGQRVYGPTKFLNVRVFGFAAKDVAASVNAGDRVNVAGNIEHHEWQSNNGPKDDWSLFAESVTLPLPRADRGQQGNNFGGGQQSGFNNQQQNTGGFGGGQSQGNQQQSQGGFNNDPWGSTPPAGGANEQDNPPF